MKEPESRPCEVLAQSGWLASFIDSVVPLAKAGPQGTFASARSRMTLQR